MASFMAGFKSFWPEYLAAHSDPRTRAVHYLGTGVGVILVVAFCVTGNVWLLAVAPVAGYGLAMPSHPVFERNIPKTFAHPLWSLMGDFYMLYLFVTGQIEAQLRRLPNQQKD